MAFGNSFGGGIGGSSIPADGSVTTAKLADNSVATAKIIDANVTPSKLSRPYTQGSTFVLSGVSFDVTGIPSWATQIRLKLSGFSTNGTSVPILQLGDSGGIETTGYDSAVSIVTSVPSALALTAAGGLALTTTIDPSSAINGIISLELINAATNTWAMNMVGFFLNTPPTVVINSSATKSLSGVLDRLRFTTFGGTDSIDGGTCSISWQ